MYTTRAESNFNTALYLYNNPTSGAGTGTGIMFRARSSTTDGQQQATIYSSWTTNTHASRTAKLVFQTANSGVVADKLTIEGNGDATFAGNIIHSGATFKVNNNADPTMACIDADDTNYAAYMKYDTTDNVMRLFPRYAGTYYTNNLVLDRGKVGIGTASPSSYDAESDDLVVFNSTTPGITIATDDASSRGALRFADGTSGNEKYRGAVEYNHNGDAMYFRTAGAQVVSINSSGNVGIGIAPLAKLQVKVTTNVNFTTSNSGAALRLNAVNDAADTAIPMEFNASYYNFLGTGISYYAGQIQAAYGVVATPGISFNGDPDTGMWRNGANVLAFSTAGENRLNIDASGKVGIGTVVAPYQKLTVTGSSGAADGNLTAGILALTTGTGVIADTRLLFGIVDDTYAWIQAADYGVAYRDISLNPNGGNVSVGTTTPKGKFHVKPDGNGWKDSMLLEHHSGNTGWFLHPENNSDNALWFGYNSDTSLTYANQGATVSLKLNSDLSATFAGHVSLADGKSGRFGDSNDLKLYHASGASYIENDTGDLNIIQNNGSGEMIFTQDNTDGNINFNCDDMSGGVTTYITIDGGEGETNFLRNTNHADSVYAQFGTGNDLKIFHDGTNNQIRNEGGSLDFEQHVDNGTIRFYNDNGSGGVTAYFYLDGSISEANDYYTVFPDYSRAAFGTGRDLKIWHDATSSYIRNETGSLYIESGADDNDMYFRCDNGSGGLMNYLWLDGSGGVMNAEVELRFPDGIKAKFGASQDFLVYHDGSNSYLKNLTGWLNVPLSQNGMSIANADFSENIARFILNGACELYYDGSKKLDTVTGGVNITGTLTATADVVAYSDERLKTNIETLDGSKVYEMRGVSFTKDDKKGSGVIAQELEKIAPELVNDENEYKAVAYGNITGYLIEAIKDLKAEIQELKKCKECENCNCNKCENCNCKNK